MLILLDIDGVMVPAAGWKAPVLLDDGFPAFSHRAVKALNKILAATDASISLTSSHKSNYTVEAWRQIFCIRGINANISTLPTAHRKQSRGEEILAWSESNRTGDGTVIIDDDKSLNNLPQPLKSRLVLTAPLIGLTEEGADDAIKILLKPMVILK